MPRRGRVIVGDVPYHVLNRAVGRSTLFRKPPDYAAFEDVLVQAHARLPLRLLAYCVMPNHWHFVVWPREDGGREVSEFFRWLTVTHAQRYHAAHGTSGTGPLYQGRFKCFPIQSDGHLLTVLRYVERNPLRAELVRKAETWRWSSLWQWAQADSRLESLIAPWPVTRPHNWAAVVNEPQTRAEEEALRCCVRRGQPFGNPDWLAQTVEQLGLEHTMRSRGRPRKSKVDESGRT